MKYKYLWWEFPNEESEIPNYINLTLGHLDPDSLWAKILQQFMTQELTEKLSQKNEGSSS